MMDGIRNRPTVCLHKHGLSGSKVMLVSQPHSRKLFMRFSKVIRWGVGERERQQNSIPTIMPNLGRANCKEEEPVVCFKDHEGEIHRSKNPLNKVIIRSQ